MRRHARIHATVELHLSPARDSHQLDMVWRCEVSALVRHYPATHDHPADTQIEELEIDGVTHATISYTQPTGWWLHEFDGDESRDAVHYLNFNLGDRDDWREAIEGAVMEKFAETALRAA